MGPDPSARVRVRPYICERVLGDAMPGVWGVYDRYSCEEEKTQALPKLSDLIERIVKPEVMIANSIPLRFCQPDKQADLQSTG